MFVINQNQVNNLDLINTHMSFPSIIGTFSINFSTLYISQLIPNAFTREYCRLSV